MSNSVNSRSMDLVYWISERYNIKLRREKGDPPPWTPDPLMATVRYCNVHREDDKVTRWMRQNWSDKDSPTWWFVLGRMLNYIPTLEDIVEHGVTGEGRGIDVLPDLDGLNEGLKAVRESGKKIFTSAYTISTCGKSMDKIDYVTDWVCERVKKYLGEGEVFIVDNKLESFHRLLTKVDGLGSFLAAQVVADMKNTDGHPLQKADDWWTFSAPGPGSLRGLSWWKYGTPEGVTSSWYAQTLKECRAEVDPLIPIYIPQISDQDFQNCLCEFSKYMKIKTLGGHPRNVYRAYNS